jgi:hypothetical protein
LYTTELRPVLRGNTIDNQRRMLRFTIEEQDRRIRSTLCREDLEDLRRLMLTRLSTSRLETQSFPKITVEIGNNTRLGFYPDEIKIQIGSAPAEPIALASYQVLKFDEMFGRYLPITIKKEDERRARMERVRAVLEQFNRDVLGMVATSDTMQQKRTHHGSVHACAGRTCSCHLNI